MDQKITLSRFSLVAVAVFLVVGAMVTAILLHYVAEAPLPFTMLITCLSPAALVLLLYIGHLYLAQPEKSAYLVALKLLGLLSILLGVVFFLDFLLPPEEIPTNVRSTIIRDDHCIVRIGKFRQEVSPALQDRFFDGQNVRLKATLLFDRVEAIVLAGETAPVWQRSTGAKVGMIIIGLVLLIPLGLFRISTQEDPPRRNIATYLFMIAPSYILSLISIGVWIKFLLVHVFGAIETM